MDDKLTRRNNIHAVAFDEEEDGSDERERADKRKLSSGWMFHIKQHCYRF